MSAQAEAKRVAFEQVGTCILFEPPKQTVHAAYCLTCGQTFGAGWGQIDADATRIQRNKGRAERFARRAAEDHECAGRPA